MTRPDANWRSAPTRRLRVVDGRVIDRRVFLHPLLWALATSAFVMGIAAVVSPFLVVLMPGGGQ